MKIITREICKKFCDKFYSMFPDGDYISCIYYVLESLGYDKYGEKFEEVEKFCY